MGILLNDVHSRLNPTEVESVSCPRSVEEVGALVRQAQRAGKSLSVGGGRHAMGGQQFGAGTIHIDSRGLCDVISFDDARGLLTIGAGAAWPEIIRATHGLQPGNARWGIRQKQTGADDLTLGGAIAANAHGRGLQMGPIVDDIEDLTVVTAEGEVRTIGREHESELFSLVVGGYGLFGVITSATLRLAPRQKMRRLVDIIDIDDAMNAVYRRVAEGCVYGDFQYAIDSADDSFLRRGVFACYRPASPSAPINESADDLTREQWLGLLHLAHTNKAEAFRVYARHYLDSHGRTYWSDSMQLSMYVPSYAEFLAEALGKHLSASLMITELYVPPERLIAFMGASRKVLRRTGVQDIYGTIRAIRADSTSFLPWAQDARACVIFNLLTEHTQAGIDRSRAAARGLIDAAADLGGSFFLTYHRWATREQLLRCHPRLPDFLARKQHYDPDELFVSDWYRYLKSTLSGVGSVPDGGLT